MLAYFLNFPDVSSEVGNGEDLDDVVYVKVFPGEVDEVGDLISF